MREGRSRLSELITKIWEIIMNKIIRFGFALTVLATVLAVNARADDAVAAWNAISETAVKTAGHPPPVAALDFAIVHLAIYDAVESIDRRYEPYYTHAPGATGSLSAAAAKAGHDVLVGLFPAQSATVNAEYVNYLAANGVDPLDPGTAVGALAAANMLALRANDGRFPANPPPFLGGNAIGQWRPTPSLLPGSPPSLAPGLTPWVASVNPFTMMSDSQFRIGPPPDLTSDKWADDYNEVKSVGALQSTTRTAEQTDMAYFWADSGPILWQNALRYISGNYLNDVGDSARMYALAEAALADAQIACWDSKYFYDFWRPITAIRLGDQDGNPLTAVDPGWQPLINTPNFPEYPSGHADISAAISHMLQLFFASDVLSFQMTTTNPLALQKTRAFTHLSQAEQEVVDARVYSGIHYRNSDTSAREQGRRVAKWVFKHYLRPVDAPADDSAN
ncbi:MAG TPA: vanadium-dependent haloperoxidase [Steroidobacteraceae bacterium]|nr:vanadium-dependent haloperoxidase [Steroidobacteraceae bacterium]